MMMKDIKEILQTILPSLFAVLLCLLMLAAYDEFGPDLKPAAVDDATVPLWESSETPECRLHVGSDPTIHEFEEWKTYCLRGA